jgi:conjugative transfer signal peptidase TraF
MAAEAERSPAAARRNAATTGPAFARRRAGAGRDRQTPGTTAARLATGCALTLVAAALAAGLPRLRLNLSPSLPIGLYRLTARAGSEPGDLVLACPPPAFAALARARHYLLPGSCPGGTLPLGKLVVAAAGDRVEATPRHLAVNGLPLPGTAAAAADAGGRPLPHLATGCRPVPGGEVWIAAPHPRSLDSRYFGPIATAHLLGRLAPLALLGHGEPLAALAAAIHRAHAGTRRGCDTGAAATCCPPGRRRQATDRLATRQPAGRGAAAEVPPS